MSEVCSLLGLSHCFANEGELYARGFHGTVLGLLEWNVKLTSFSICGILKVISDKGVYTHFIYECETKQWNEMDSLSKIKITQTANVNLYLYVESTANSFSRSPTWWAAVANMYTAFSCKYIVSVPNVRELLHIPSFIYIVKHRFN